MKDITQVYTDGVETIHVLNATVRLDLFTLQPPQEGNTPSPEVFQRLIMPVQSFINMHGAMQQIMDKMLQDGIITANTQPDQKHTVG